jgi:acyl-coenzyme A thioesterase PaaI-like protein
MMEPIVPSMGGRCVYNYDIECCVAYVCTYRTTCTHPYMFLFWRQGRDLVHDQDAPVRILDYYANYGPGIASFSRGGVGTTLTGVCHFTKRAESHAGYCHGGSMCSLMDDVIGWAAFLVTGKCCPWTGFTVQINSSLQRPILVDSILLVQATITKVERRKVSVTAAIVDPSQENAIHATGEGLVILNRGVLPDHDEKETSKESRP